MSIPILTSKLYIPPLRANLVPRSRLIDQLQAGMQGKLTLISAPAGFGKTTLVSAWAAHCAQPVAWLSLDEEDNDPARFFAYLVTALQQITPTVGQNFLRALQSPQLPPVQTILPTLLNEISANAADFILVLDDYHVLHSATIDDALSFLLEHLPPPIHLVIITREDPALPLSRLRARAQLNEVRAAQLRFTATEAADFLNQAMGLQLTAVEIDALETRTEGWIAGLQLAAVSIQSHQSAGNQDAAAFIQSFTGSHRFVMDYLMEEVLGQQPAHIQRFLLYTSVLDRMCGSLCDAILRTESGAGQRTLEALEQANLFIVPLDNERRWYRYHHLFAELLRQRLQQTMGQGGADSVRIEDLHIRASQWYEAQGRELDAFQQATLAHDIARAERLVEGQGMPLHFRGAIRPVLHWLETLPATVLDAHPSLWLAFASTLLGVGQVARTEEALAAAESVLHAQAAERAPHDQERDLIGRIAAIRATIAAGRQQADVMIAQSRRALDYLLPDNLAFRTATHWKLGYAYHLEGNLIAAKQAYQDAIVRSQASGNAIFTIMSHIGLGDIYQVETQLRLAAEHFNSAIELYGEQPLPSAGEAFSGLAQIYYEWNDLDAAQRHAEQGLQLGRQWENSDSPVHSQWMLARVQLAQGEVGAALSQLAQTSAFMRKANFIRHLDEVTATQVLALLLQGNLTDAAALAASRELPLSQAQVYLAQGDIDRALVLLEATHATLHAKGRLDESLQAMVLQAVALYMAGRVEEALARLGQTLVLAEAGGYIRLFIDASPIMPQLLARLQPQAAQRGVTSAYLHSVQAAVAAAAQRAVPATTPHVTTRQPLPEPLSPREIEVLQLIAAGRKNREIADALIVSLNTVRYHTKNLYGKLGVNKRTQAVAKAQALGLL
ncbi:MAG: AAA family ATPase [Caldilineaceae bacterium]|nr:AAA family ATPase [Caldilineaceae bacterium]